jgi:hypothetical protein
VLPILPDLCGVYVGLPNLIVRLNQKLNTRLASIYKYGREKLHGNFASKFCLDLWHDLLQMIATGIPCRLNQLLAREYCVSLYQWKKKSHRQCTGRLTSSSMTLSWTPWHGSRFRKAGWANEMNKSHGMFKHKIRLNRYSYYIRHMYYHFDEMEMEKINATLKNKEKNLTIQFKSWEFRENKESKKVK